MKRNVSDIIIVVFVLVLLLSGCGGNMGNAVLSIPATAEAQKPTEKATPTQAVTVPETPEAVASAPNVTSASQPADEPPVPEPAVYIIDGAKIYRQSDDTLIYDAALYFEKSWDCTVAHLQVEDGVLYFTEGGMPGEGGNEEDSKYRVIRKDEYGRTVLQEDNVIGYTQLILYGNKIFIVQDGFDSQSIKWASKDGNSAKDLDLSEYAAQYGILPDYNSAALYMKDGKLYADISFYVDADPDTEEEIADHTVSISEDLEITRIS